MPRRGDLTPAAASSTPARSRRNSRASSGFLRADRSLDRPGFRRPGSYAPDLPEVMWGPPMVAPPTTPRSFAVDVARASAAFQELARQMGAQFLDKQETIRLMTVSAI